MSQAIQTIKNAINRPLPADDLTEGQKTTVSKMEIVENDGKLDTKSNDIAERLAIAESLFGILPSTITDKDIENIKEERLRCSDE